MARQCRKICNDPLYFSKKRLPWDKGSHCMTCDVWVKDPTRKNFDDLFIGSVPDPHSYPHYYDIEGKRSEVTILLPVKQMVRRDENGTLLQIIKELVSKVECRCCRSICRSRPHTKSKNHYIPSDRPRGRPKGSGKYKERVDEIVYIIKLRKGTMWELTLEDVTPHPCNKVKKRLEKENEGKESNIDN